MIWFRPPMKYRAWEADLGDFEARGPASRILRELLPTKTSHVIPDNDRDRLPW